MLGLILMAPEIGSFILDTVTEKIVEKIMNKAGSTVLSALKGLTSLSVDKNQDLTKAVRSALSAGLTEANVTLVRTDELTALIDVSTAVSEGKDPSAALAALKTLTASQR